MPLVREEDPDGQWVVRGDIFQGVGGALDSGWVDLCGALATTVCIEDLSGAWTAGSIVVAASNRPTQPANTVDDLGATVVTKAPAAGGAVVEVPGPLRWLRVRSPSVDAALRISVYGRNPF